MHFTYPKNAYTLQETIFEKLDEFNIPYTEELKLCSNVAIFDFQTISVPTDELKATKQQPGLDNVFFFLSE